MYPESSLWLLIAVAWATALLPFFTEFSFVFMPWRQGTQKKGYGFIRLLLFLLQVILVLIGAYYLAQSSDSNYQMAAGIGFIVLFVIPAITSAKNLRVKPFVNRLFELLLFYFAIGAFGFAVEGYYANTVPQGWQFYAIGLCLFCVLAYPGFVLRHLMRNKHNQKVDRT